jgi:ssDNA-binding replication factor A large subunit
VKISELEANSNFESLRVRILSKQGPTRVGSRAKGMKFVWNLLLADETGTTVLSLWGVHTGDNYKTGEVIQITNGWCKLYAGAKQVSLGREGKIAKVPDDPSLPRQLEP